MGLHHMSKQDRHLTLNEVSRVLKTGGSLIVADYNLPEKALTRLMALAYVRVDKCAEAYKMCTCGSLPEEIEMAGLRIKRRESICRGLIQLIEAIHIQ